MAGGRYRQTADLPEDKPKTALKKEQAMAVDGPVGEGVANACLVRLNVETRWAGHGRPPVLHR